jgi:hypothetical protein
VTATVVPAARIAAEWSAIYRALCHAAEAWSAEHPGHDYAVITAATAMLAEVLPDSAVSAAVAVLTDPGSGRAMNDFRAALAS